MDKYPKLSNEDIDNYRSTILSKNTEQYSTPALLKFI